MFFGSFLTSIGDCICGENPLYVGRALADSVHVDHVHEEESLRQAYIFSKSKIGGKG